MAAGEAPVGRRPPGGGRVELVALRKSFGDQVAVDGIDLDISPGEFFSLLGPSGCGKTTTLRLIAGFERPDEGSILIDGKDEADVPAHQRPVNTVFQSYALFPHLSVADNVGYGLRWRKGLSSSDRTTMAGRALELVQMSKYAERRPNQLSGGQQQRVALARALVLEPSVLLLDEPLGALDAKLRKSLRGELTALQREVGITFILVTHDQEEALEMSDRLAVMDGGHVVQCGAPRDVYEAPCAEFVADFLGLANVMDVECLDAHGEQRSIRLGGVVLQATAPAVVGTGAARAVVRPERVRLDHAGRDHEPQCLSGVVERMLFLGATTQVFVRLADGGEVQALLANSIPGERFTAGDKVSVQLPADALRVLVSARGAAEADADEPVRV